MSAKQVFIVFLLLIIGCQQAGVNQDTNSTYSDANKMIDEPELDRQLKIYKSALFEGKNEQIRIEAAAEILLSENPLARKMILEALQQSENSDARIAVCKALIQARSARESIRNKEDFVQPLLGVLASNVAAEAQLAAEASLIFDYEIVGGALETMASDTTVPVGTRLNALHALKLQPDKRAAIRLVRLVDDPDRQVSTAAEEALYSLGIPVSRDAETREQIIAELQLTGRDEFLRHWLIRQEEQLRTMRKELSLWQGRYLAALSKIYDSISDDAARSKFLSENLVSAETVVKLWVLEKIRQDRVATRPNPKLSSELGPTLISLISDPNREVRLRTAKLPLIGELNSAERLLAQLNVEQDDEVKTELFVALGRACYYALLPNSPVKIPEDVRRETLAWAAKYLTEEKPAKAQRGAEVMKRLLELDGLAPTEVDRYLDMIAVRYTQAKSNSDGALRGELLGAMAGLCAQGSACKVKATKFFRPFFEDALRDETNRIREAAVDGLIYIDKTAALKRLRVDSINDPSVVVRKRVAALAGEVGGVEDLDWLAERIGSNSESEPAWQAMLKIFSRSEVDVLDQWMSKFESGSFQGKLSKGQQISFLEMAGQRAESENNADVLRRTTTKLANLYRETGEFEQAVKYLELMLGMARSGEEKDLILSDYINLYLAWSKPELAVGIVKKCLVETDLEPNGVIVRSIDNYLSEPYPGTDPNAFIGALSSIKIAGSESRPKWQQQLRLWEEHFGKSQDSVNSSTEGD